MSHLIEKIRSVKFQLILIFLAFSVVSASGIAGISLSYLFRAEREMAVDQAVRYSEVIGARAQILVENTAKIYQWVNGRNVRIFLNTDGDKFSASMALINDMAEYRTTELTNQTIENVYVFDRKGTAYDEKTGVHTSDRSKKSRQIETIVTATPGRLIAISKDEDQSGDNGFIIYGMAIMEQTTNKWIGSAAIEFKNDAFESFLNEQHPGKSGSYFIADSNAQILVGESQIFEKVSAPGHVMPADNSSYELLEDGTGRDVLCVYKHVPNTDWWVCGCVYLHELMHQMEYIRMLILLGTIGMILGSACISFLVAAKLARPITRMKELMLDAEGGNLDAVVTEISPNEFGVLEKQYNRMLTELKKTLETHKQDQEYLQKAKLKSLQAQIAPHFLYNTLDTIIWLVAVNENEKAIEMTENLAVFFKTGLSNGLDWISVEKEVEHVKSYLYIQQSRYNDILTCETYMDSALLGYDMLKMTLQPIVENAIYHGIKNKSGGGKIIINGFLENEEYLIFDIIDTGIGMEAGMVDRLNESMRSNAQSYKDEGMGFGLYNVNRRIRLYYDDPACGLYVTSHLDEGTTVRIRLKRIKGKESYV